MRNKLKQTLLIIVTLMLTMLAAVLLNVPILREIISFVYLTFVPGYLITRIVKLRTNHLADTLFFSVGLSLAFLMLLGLLINESYLLGVSQPLSAVPLVLGVSISNAILLYICYRLNLLDDSGWYRVNLKLTKVFLLRCIILVLPIVLGLVGALFLNGTIMMFTIVLIVVLFALSILSKKLIPSKLYPFLIFSVSLALLFQVVFTSKYIIGFDANLEFYVFTLTQSHGHWEFFNFAISAVGRANYDAMLSITLLPTLYSNITHLSGELLFKILYPLVSSLIPVILYRIYEGQIGKLASLSCVLFFVSNILIFYGFGPISLNRQIIATFFLVLSIFVLFEKRISTGNRKLLMIIFCLGIATSHYSLAFTYLAVIFFIFFLSKVRKKSESILNGQMVILLSAIIFYWYSLAQSPLITLQLFFQGIISRFSADFLNEASRTGGSALSSPVANIGSFSSSFTLVVFYTAHFFIVIGLIMLLLNPKKVALDLKYRSLAILSSIILILCFLVPGLAPSFNLDRFYGITLLFLVPLFVLGFNDFIDLCKKVWFKTIGRWLFKKSFAKVRNLLLTILIICFLLTQSGFINRITGTAPLVRVLDFDRVITSNDSRTNLDFHTVYISETDVSSALWISKHNEAGLKVYGDLSTAPHVLTCYFPAEQLYYLSEDLIADQDALIYLGTLNVVHSIVNYNGAPTNISVLSGLLNQSSLICNNGNSQVWDFVSAK